MNWSAMIQMVCRWSSYAIDELKNLGDRDCHWKKIIRVLRMLSCSEIPDILLSLIFFFSIWRTHTSERMEPLEVLFYFISVWSPVHWQRVCTKEAGGTRRVESWKKRYCLFENEGKESRWKETVYFYDWNNCSHWLSIEVTLLRWYSREFN